MTHDSHNHREHTGTGIADRLPRLGGRSTEEVVLLSLCALGVVGVTPFMLTRLFLGEILLGVIDAVALAAIFAIAARVWTTRSVHPYNIVISVLYLAVMVVVIHLKGMVLLGWAYPTLIAPFFLLDTRTSLGLAAIAILALLPAIFGDLSLVDAASALMTIAVTIVFAWVFAAETTRQRASLHHQARSDALTRTGNRRALEDMLRRLAALRDRQGNTASLILFDLDRFKCINDGFGHEVGDMVLVEIAAMVGERLRRTDALFRIGGEEFVAVATGATGQQALRAAENLRSLIEAARFTHHRLAITISLGVAEVQPGDEPASWLRRADVALYGAKHGGRNAVRSDQELGRQSA